MNILQLQDRLKDLSDQQLAREMQNPMGGAPQYLVLTELQRRKKMREAMPQQQGQQRSMAEEAVAGIASLAPPEEPEQMAVGGVVRMAGGGDISSMSVDELRRLLDDLSDPRFRGRAAIPDASPDAVRAALAAAMDAEDAGYRGAPQTQFSRDAGAFTGATGRMASGLGEDIAAVTGAFRSGARSAGQVVRGAGQAVADYFTQPTLPSNEGVPPVVDVSPTPRDYDYQTPGPADSSIPTPPAYVPEAQARAQSQGRGGAGVPGGGGGVGIASTGVPNPAAPPPAQEEDYISQLRKELADQRSEVAKDREEARNMALIEAGLRIAGSQSPHFASAVAEAAPAVQSYAKANSDIRRNDRERRQLQIALEREATMDKYRSAQERRMDEQTALERMRIGLAERELGVRTSKANADPMDKARRLFSGLYDEEYDPKNQGHTDRMMSLLGKEYRQPPERENREYRLKELKGIVENPMMPDDVRKKAQDELLSLIRGGGGAPAGGAEFNYQRGRGLLPAASE